MKNWNTDVWFDVKFIQCTNCCLKCSYSVNGILKHHSVNWLKFLQLSLSQFKHIRFRGKSKHFSNIWWFNMMSTQWYPKTQMFACALCEQTCAPAFEIFGDRLERYRLNCCIKDFTKILKHWCFGKTLMIQTSMFNKHKIWHLCLIYICL